VVGRQIRACTPAPGAWTLLGDTRLKLGPVRVSPPGQPAGNGQPAAGTGQATAGNGQAAAGTGQAGAVPGPLAPGELWAGRAGVFVGTATDPVELGEVQPPGKRPMAAAAWVRGLHLDPAGAGHAVLVFG